MAIIDTSKVEFITTKNIINANYSAWTGTGTVLSESNTLEVGPGCYMETFNSNESDLKGSDYLKISFNIVDLIAIEDINNYVDKVGIDLILDYKELGELPSERVVERININKYNIKKGEFTYITNVYGRGYTKIQVRISNSGNAIFKLGSVKLYRSKSILTNDDSESGGKTSIYIECRTDDPIDALPGRIWLRTDL